MENSHQKGTKKSVYFTMYESEIRRFNSHFWASWLNIQFDGGGGGRWKWKPQSAHNSNASSSSLSLHAEANNERRHTHTQPHTVNTVQILAIITTVVVVDVSFDSVLWFYSWQNTLVRFFFSVYFNNDDITFHLPACAKAQHCMSARTHKLSPVTIATHVNTFRK